MRKKNAILVAVCFVVVAAAVSFEYFVSKTPVQQTSTDTTVINGLTYSTKTTPYGVFTIRCFVLLPGGSMEARGWTCWLLYPNEPAPPNVRVEPTGTLQIMSVPGLTADVMIDGWLYSQTPTGFTKFINPPSTVPLWTETPYEPLPANAQVQR